MKPSQILFLGVALFLVAQSIASAHRYNCGLDSGTDACGCTKSVVRAVDPIRPVKYADPRVIHEAITIKRNPVRSGCGGLISPRKPTGPSVVDLLKHNHGPIAPRFDPVGDLCTTCKQAITEVIPAYPGKPVCRVCAEKAKAHECSLSDPSHSNVAITTTYSSSNPELNTFEDEGLSFDEQESIYNARAIPSVPADPVSLSLAYGLAQQTVRNVPESRLAFGPKSTPVDGSRRKTVVEIPEERLLTIDRPLVELKITPKQSMSTTYAELVAEQEALEQRRIELEAQAQSTQEPSFISYGELGYGPVTSTGTNFVSTITSEPVTSDTEADETPCGPLGPAIPGYRSGNVIVRSHQVADETEEDQYSDGSYEDPDSDNSYSSEEQESYSCGGGLLARLRASAHAQNSCGCGK